MAITKIPSRVFGIENFIDLKAGSLLLVSVPLEIFNNRKFFISAIK